MSLTLNTLRENKIKHSGQHQVLSFSSHGTPDSAMTQLICLCSSVEPDARMISGLKYSPRIPARRSAVRCQSEEHSGERTENDLIGCASCFDGDHDGAQGERTHGIHTIHGLGERKRQEGDGGYRNASGGL